MRKHLNNAVWFDLLKTDVYLSLLRDPSLLRKKVEALEPGRWVVIDEVQRIPALLREIHAIIAERGDAYRFALCGSSARKLRRMDVDLLAGRVFERKFFSLTAIELGEDLDIDRLLSFGSLPKVYSEPQHAVDILESYVHTYLRQEIQQEALVKDIGSFDRFLEIAAIMNGQVINTAAIARDAGVARTSVQRYLAVLADTLIGARLEAWKPRLKVKEVSKPKFYLFDPGIVRALSGMLRDPLERAEKGPLLETMVFNELRAWIAYSGSGGKLHYWRTSEGKEVDFIWSRGKHGAGFEVKASNRWRGSWSRALSELLDHGAIQKAYGIYLGNEALQDGPIRVLPFRSFAQEIHRGKLLP